MIVEDVVVGHEAQTETVVYFRWTVWVVAVGWSGRAFFAPDLAPTTPHHHTHTFTRTHTTTTKTKNKGRTHRDARAVRLRRKKAANHKNLF